MISIIKHAAERIVDAAQFIAAVWHDARSLQREAESRHGGLGF